MHQTVRQTHLYQIIKLQTIRQEDHLPQQDHRQVSHQDLLHPRSHQPVSQGHPLHLHPGQIMDLHLHRDLIMVLHPDHLQVP